MSSPGARETRREALEGISNVEGRGEGVDMQRIEDGEVREEV